MSALLAVPLAGISRVEVDAPTAALVVQSPARGGYVVWRSRDTGYLLVRDWHRGYLVVPPRCATVGDAIAYYEGAPEP